MLKPQMDFLKGTLFVHWYVTFRNYFLIFLAPLVYADLYTEGQVASYTSMNHRIVKSSWIEN